MHTKTGEVQRGKSGGGETALRNLCTQNLNKEKKNQCEKTVKVHRSSHDLAHNLGINMKHAKSMYR